MNPIALVHNAARHLCMDRIAMWNEDYGKLISIGGHRVAKANGDWTYSEKAYEIFPRYQVLQAILDEIEGFTPDDFESLDDARSLIAAAADTAENHFTQYSNSTAIAAVRDERGYFRTFIMSETLDRFAQFDPLPFRKRLTDEVHKQLHAEFKGKWGAWYGGCTDSKTPPPNVTLHVEVMKDPDAYARLRQALVEHSITRVFELREYDSGYELDVELAGFTYTGAEGLWTSGDLTWMVYASHEASITFGGEWLISKMRTTLPNFDRYLYKGWDLAAYR